MQCPDSSAIQAFLGGDLAGEPARAVEVHMDSCGECRRVIAALVREEGGDAPIDIGSRVGRYVVTGRLGGGAMGVVFAARDPDLDRPVALKLLRGESGARVALRARLVREAQAMARLAHPNVVAVHDVGEHGDQVFIAMELVEGQTVGDWLRTRPPWRGVLAVFVAAGRGLAAAHAAGLVHRDVKPDNILLGADGRARITDFGLVGASAGPPGGSTLGSGATELTRTGTVMGTPAYMAPEQHRGESVDERSDQFCFCIALYEGLYGRRPFVGRTAEELAAATAQAEPEFPRRPAIPPRLVRALRRGLDADPARRHPSMAALLDELEAVPRVIRRRRIVAAIAVALALAIGGGGLAWWRGRSGGLIAAGARCGGGPVELARAWTPARRAALLEAFARSPATDGRASGAAVVSALDRYAGEWLAMHKAACVATRVSGHQSEALLDRRMRCLAGRLDELDALVGAYAAPDRPAVSRALAQVRSLPPVADCGQVVALAAVVAPPPGSQARLRAAELEAGRLEVRLRAGEREKARPAAEALLVEARAIGYPPLTARALFNVAFLVEKGGDPAEAERLYTEAVAEAERGGDDLQRARYQIELAWMVGFRRADPARGLGMLDQAEAVLRRAGDRELEARVAATRGRLFIQAARYDEAIAALELAIRLYAERPGRPALEAAGAADNLAATLEEVGRSEDALRENQRAIELARAVGGPRHADVGRMLGNLGIKLASLGRHAEALEAYRQALDIQGEVHGEDSWQVALARANAGDVHAELGDYDRALADLAAARATFVRIDGDDRTLRVALVDYYAAGVRARRGELAAALTLLRHVDEIGRVVLGDDHPDRAQGQLRIAAIELERGRAREAHAIVARVLPIAERSKRRLFIAEALAVGGGAALALGRAGEAVPRLERAIALYGEQPGSDWAIATVRFALARARHALGERAAARALADAARGGYAALGDRHPRDVARLERWLRQHR